MQRLLLVKLLSAVVGLSLVAGHTAARPDDTPKEPADLQGCWKLVSVEVDGEARDPTGGGVPRWVVKGDKLFYGGEEVAHLVVDPSTTPKVIDLKFRGPDRVYEGVYGIEKDTLKVCLNAKPDAKDRPGQFATKDQPDLRLLVFEREKGAPENPTEGLTAFAGIQLRKDSDNNAIVVDAPIKGSPAEKAGLKKGDVIRKVGGNAVADLDGTVKAIRQAKPGAKLEIEVSREGKDNTITVTVGVFPLAYALMLG